MHSAREDKLLLAEYGPLRSNVNDTIMIMSRNEFVCAGFVFGFIVFEFAVQPAPAYLHWFVLPLGALLAVGTVLWGRARYHALRFHLDMEERYLARLERHFSPRFGWTNYYRSQSGVVDLERPHPTRAVFWRVMVVVATLNLAVCFMHLFANL